MGRQIPAPLLAQLMSIWLSDQSTTGAASAPQRYKASPRRATAEKPNFNVATLSTLGGDRRPCLPSPQTSEVDWPLEPSGRGAEGQREEQEDQKSPEEACEANRAKDGCERDLYEEGGREKDGREEGSGQEGHGETHCREDGARTIGARASGVAGGGAGGGVRYGELSW